jgi:hypothetical protein
MMFFCYLGHLRPYGGWYILNKTCRLAVLVLIVVNIVLPFIIILFFNKIHFSIVFEVWMYGLIPILMILFVKTKFKLKDFLEKKYPSIMKKNGTIIWDHISFIKDNKLDHDKTLLRLVTFHLFYIKCITLTLICLIFWVIIYFIMF